MPLPRFHMAVLAVLGLLGLGMLDWATGDQFGLFVFYFVPIALMAATYGAVPGLAMAVATTVNWFLLDAASGHRRFSSAFLLYWNTGIRLVSLAIIALGVARIRDALIRERRLNRDLTEAIAKVRQLSGLLPICGSCKHIRNDAGYWEQLENYIETHSDVLFSHGLCPACLARLRGELAKRETVDAG